MVLAYRVGAAPNDLSHQPVRGEKNISVRMKNLRQLAKIAIYSCILLAIGSTGFLYQKGYRMFIVQSGSMEPSLSVGSAVIVQPSNTYNVGDVITYRTGQNTVVTHRISSVSEEGSFFTKGDANQDVDANAILPEQVLGNVALSISYVGSVFMYARTLPGYVLFIIIPGLYLLIHGLFNVIHALRKTESPHTINTSFVVIATLTSSLFYTISHTNAFFSATDISEDNTFATLASFPKTVALYESNPFTCQGGAQNTTSAYGDVTFVKNGAHLDLNITVDGAVPNTTYAVWVNQHPGACPLSSATFPFGLTTDATGDANVSLATTLQSGATHYWISVVGGGQVLRSISAVL